MTRGQSLALTLAIGGFALLAWYRARLGGGLDLGTPAPEIAAERWFGVEGAPPRLADLRGRPVLLEFWATWCGSCREAWPHLVDLQAEFADAGLVVLALSAEDPDAVAAYLERTSLPFPVAAGSRADAAYAVHALPKSVLVDRAGRVAWVGHPGTVTEQRVAALVE